MMIKTESDEKLMGVLNSDNIWKEQYLSTLQGPE